MTLIALPSPVHLFDRPVNSGHMVAPLRSPRPLPVRPLAGQRSIPRDVALPVTNVRQGAMVAMHRTRRFTLLGEVPVVGVMVVPWLWPLHMVIVALTADHIRHTPDASLSYYDGRRPERHRAAAVLAVGSALIWMAFCTATVFVLLHLGAAAVAVIVAAILVLPVLIELAGLIEFAVFNPEWLTLKRQGRGRTDGRTTYVLTSLVSREDGHDFAGRLIDLTYPQWQAADAVVIGYPASTGLVSYYVRMGARRDLRCAAGGRPARRRVAFDCRQPLRAR